MHALAVFHKDDIYFVLIHVSSLNGDFCMNEIT